MPANGDDGNDIPKNGTESAVGSREPSRPLIANLSALDEDGTGRQSSRVGDNGALHFSASDKAARFFGRRSQKNVANYAPFARPRDAAGDSRGRKIVYDYPLPDDRMLETYNRAIDHVAPKCPMRAALLADMLGRVVGSLDRYRELRREEEEKHQNFNEEARRADNFIDEQIEEIRTERDSVVAELDGVVEDAIAARAAARETAAVARAAAGYGLDFALIDDTIDEPPPASAKQAAVTQASTAPVEAKPAPKQVVWKVKAPEPAAVPQIPVTVESATYKGGEIQPVYVPFPLSEGLVRARPIESIAVERGLPIESPAARQMTAWSRAFGWCSLVASGIIFGISIGLLIKAIDPEMFSLRPERVIGPALVLGLIGVAMFWALGRIVSLLAALASEERHAGMLASNRLEPDVVGRWLKRTAITTLMTLGLTTIVLVAIEANVERWGIVQVFLDNTANNIIASGAHAHATSGPGFWTIFCLVLTVSLPFVLFHAAEGWVESRARSIASYLKAQRAHEAWQIASSLHSERLEEVRTMMARAEAEEADRVAERKAKAVAQGAATAANAAAERQVAQALPPMPAYEPASSLDVLPQYSPIPLGFGGPAGQVRDGDIALAIERAREAHARLREARGKRQTKLAEFDERIEALEAERRPERVDMDTSGQRRIEDAYHDYIGAAIHFDGIYRREMGRIEHLSQPGVLYGLKEFFFRAPR